jgi:ribosomal protein S27AE
MAANHPLCRVAEQSPVVQAIRRYEQDVGHHRVRPQVRQCPRCGCGADRPAFFRCHETRARTFLVAVADLVYTVLSVITRWKCGQCRRTFTWYPAFAVPHKRYVLAVILARCHAYAERDEQSYRTGVQDGGKPVFHEQPQGQQITAGSTEEEKAGERVPALAHTTLYRWVSMLGAWGHTLRRAWELIKQRHPEAGVLRELAVFRVAPGKFRSRVRGGVVHGCRSLCVTEAVYRELFGVSIFPHLATACGWR